MNFRFGYKVQDMGESSIANCSWNLRKYLTWMEIIHRNTCCSKTHVCSQKFISSVYVICTDSEVNVDTFGYQIFDFKRIKRSRQSNTRKVPRTHTINKVYFFLNERKKAKIKIIKKWYHMAGYACIIGDAYSVDAKMCVLLEIIWFPQSFLMLLLFQVDLQVWNIGR